MSSRRAAGAADSRAFEPGFANTASRPNPKIGIGDTISVSIWEAAGGGLFSCADAGRQVAATVATGSQNVTIPDQMVTRDGAISVPFAGRIAVAGRSPLEVQHEIEQRLAEKAIEPQVLVTVVKSVTNIGDRIGGGRQRR